ncbi:hypothetical protein BC830DRAFT_1145957 [Chytriomyces sp. MP71]|nr:hypothetical protein BC830DRAFT_1145957 [Chytriomyces sp. MP71]
MIILILFLWCEMAFGWDQCLFRVSVSGTLRHSPHKEVTQRTCVVFLINPNLTMRLIPIAVDIVIFATFFAFLLRVGRLGVRQNKLTTLLPCG